MLIKVNWLHIKKGKMGDPNSCPIANAITSQFKVKGLSVNVANVVDISYSTPKGGIHIDVYASLPQKAEKFIENFDREGSKAVKPFEFDLKLPKDVQTFFKALGKGC
jgi:hypothetical protein